MKNNKYTLAEARLAIGQYCTTSIINIPQWNETRKITKVIDNKVYRLDPTDGNSYSIIPDQIASLPFIDALRTKSIYKLVINE